MDYHRRDDSRDRREGRGGVVDYYSRDGDARGRRNMYGSDARRDSDSREYRERLPLPAQQYQYQHQYPPPYQQYSQHQQQQQYYPPHQQYPQQQRNLPPPYQQQPQQQQQRNPPPPYQQQPQQQQQRNNSPRPPMPPQLASPPLADLATTTAEERQTAADMVRAALPLWRSERRINGNKKDRLWAFDPRTCCWNANMVAPGCVDARTCRCAPLPSAPALSRTILHDLLPRALPVLEQQFGPSAAAVEEETTTTTNDEAAADDEAAVAKEEVTTADETEEEEDWWSLPIIEYPSLLPPSPQQQQQKRVVAPTAAATTTPPWLGRSTGQLAFCDGVLFAGRRFVPAVRGMPPTLVVEEDTTTTTTTFDQTCAFPFGYEPFRPDVDADTLAALRRLLLDRFWGPDADVFLAYLAAAYTGAARGKMVISAPGAPPPLICACDDAEQQRSAAARHAVALARWERHCNTGPQYLERLLRAVHGDDAAAAAAATSHLVECDTYRRFTRRMPLVDCQAWVSARAHHRLMWMRPTESELVFMPSAHQPGAPAFGPASRGDRRLASLRKLQALARIDAPRTVELLCGGSFGAFLMWPRPVLPVLDGFVAPNAPGTPAAENCWSQPLAARLRTVTHAAWTAEDEERQEQGEEADWAVQLDRFLQTTPRDMLRRAWVELLLRAAEKDEGMHQTRLSPFVIGPLGYPAEMLAHPRASDLALLQVAPRAAQIEAVRQDNLRRGLVPRFGACWELAPRPKQVV